MVVLPYKVWSHWEHWDSPLNFADNQLLSFIYNNYKFIIAAGLLNTDKVFCSLRGPDSIGHALILP